MALSWVSFGLAGFGFLPSWLFAGLALGRFGWFGFGLSWFLGWVGFGLAGFSYLPSWCFAGLALGLVGFGWVRWVGFCQVGFCWAGFGLVWLVWLWVGLVFSLGWLWAGWFWLSLCCFFAGLALAQVGSGLWILPSWPWAALAGLALAQIVFLAGSALGWLALAFCQVGFAGLALGLVGFGLH